MLSQGTWKVGGEVIALKSREGGDGKKGALAENMVAPSDGGKAPLRAPPLEMALGPSAGLAY